MSKMTKWFLLILFLGALSGMQARAQGTYTAATCNFADVNTLVNGPKHVAVNGDTIIIPAGTCTWGSNSSSDTPLSINAGITLQGQGVSSTVINDNNSKGNSNCAGASPVISINSTSTAPLRITGFTINGQASNPNACNGGHISINGGSHALRIDHLAIQNMVVVGIRSYGDIWGVIDHNTFSGTHKQGVVVNASYWGNVGNYGDNSWAQPDSMGTAAALFIEDNTFTDPQAVSAGAFDCEAGGRFVFRHNQAAWAGLHGNDSSGRIRSCRHFEVYDNTFTSVGNAGGGGQAYTGFFIRGGTGMIFRNAWNDNGSNTYNPSNLYEVISYRDTDGYGPWGPNGTRGSCDGSSVWDANDGKTFASGTANASSSTDHLVANGSPGWTTNQWVGYSVHNSSESPNQWGSVIIANDANSITTHASLQGTAPHNWASGDSFQILHASSCFDQVGHGQGAYISSGTSSSLPTPVGPIHSALDPLYNWLNTQNGAVSTTGLHNSEDYGQGSLGHILFNREIYEYTTSFDGTSGVGSGPIAGRPATCTTGVAYWATDQGNWNQSGSGGQGVLYKCTTTNNWSSAYTPYTYPHPLVSGSGGSGNNIAAPTNLAATVQ